MDKYEFNTKVEQIKKMTAKGDLQTAMKIADGIDWRRVRNANLLSGIADIYRANGEYGEAKNILLLAFERAPVGKRILFKLAEVSIEAGELQDAEEFYREFCEMNPDDAGQYLLRYRILKEKGASPEQLLNSLEQYVSMEVDERWLYELAELYSLAGREDECIEVCDKLMLLFGHGNYVDKAMELKLQYAPLSRQQMDLVENREAGAGISGGTASESDPDYYFDNAEAAEENAEPAIRVTPRTVPPSSPVVSVDSREAGHSRTALAFQSAATAQQPGNVQPGVTAQQPGNAQPAATAQQLSHGQSVSAAQYMDNAQGDDRVSAGAVDDAGAAVQVKAGAAQTGNLPQSAGAQGAAATAAEDYEPYHMIVEASPMEEALQIAVDEIKYFHEKYQLSATVAKTTAAKLNANGFSVFVPKLRGKDLMITEAGDLNLSVVDELLNYMNQLQDRTALVLVDELDHFDALAAQRPDFIEKFDIVSDQDEPEEALFEELDLNEEAEPYQVQQTGAQTAEPYQPQQTGTQTVELYQPQQTGAQAAGSEPGIADRQTVQQAQSPRTVQSMGVQSGEAFTSASAPGPARDFRNIALREEAGEAFVSGNEPRNPVPIAQRQRFDIGGRLDTELDLPEEGYFMSEPQTGNESQPEDTLLGEDDYAQENFSGELPADYYQPMDMEDFANYAQAYARSIDCVMPGKTVLALYERIELMQEDGIVLSKASAEDLIEEAADKAEKHGFAKKLSGIFSSKYDKEGRLILREEHFIY